MAERKVPKNKGGLSRATSLMILAMPLVWTQGPKKLHRSSTSLGLTRGTKCSGPGACFPPECFHASRQIKRL